jgi:dihydrofolate reductase
MRKIIESTLVSADGVIGDPPRWAMEYRDAEVTDEALERLASAEAMLMGRGTYELFSAVWPGQSGEFADRMNSIRKYVFSATLDEAAWNNSVILRGDAVAEVTRLKQQDGGELALYGHGRLAQALLEHGLVDELRLSVHPVLVGSGQLLFRDGQKQALEFAGAKTFGTGELRQYDVSDPAKPVPYIDKIGVRMLPEYMSADQRFAARRPETILPPRFAWTPAIRKLFGPTRPWSPRKQDPCPRASEDC